MLKVEDTDIEAASATSVQEFSVMSITHAHTACPPCSSLP